MKESKNKSDFAVCLGKRIRSLREKHGFSQLKLAEMAGISGKYLGEIERGEGNISIERLLDIANSLNIPIGYFMENDHERGADTLTSEIIRLLPLLNEKETQTIYRVIKILLE